TAGVALIEAGTVGGTPRERIVERPHRRRPERASDGWVDVDESAGILQFGVEAEGAVLICGADFAAGVTPTGWEWSIHDEFGREREGALVVRELTPFGVKDTRFGTHGAFDWTALEPEHEPREGRHRVLAALVDCAPGTFATL